MIKAVLFDYGGVLSPGGKTVKGLYSKLLEIPEDEVDVEEFHNELRRGGISTQDFLKKLGEAHGKTLSEDKFIEFSDIFSKNEAVYYLAKQLRDKGIKTGILSNMYGVSADKLLKDGYYQDFDPIVLSNREGLAKPDTEFYLLAIKRTGCKPEEILFIDDQEKCLSPAKALGLHTIKADSEAQIVEDTKALFKQQNGLVL